MSPPSSQDPSSQDPAPRSANRSDSSRTAEVVDLAEVVEDLRLRAAAVRWVLTDVDGVMTDGRLHYGPDGEAWKDFQVQDGLGLKLAQRAGLKVGVLSGRGGPPLEARVRELGLDALMTQREDKATAFRQFLAEHGVRGKHVAYIGDDLVDIPVLLRAGLSFAPADAAPEVRSRVDRVLERPGGAGCVREVIRWLLEVRGEWSSVIAPYLEKA